MRFTVSASGGFNGWRKITNGSTVHGSAVGEKNENQDTNEVGEP
jgi:hypothetical protein